MHKKLPDIPIAFEQLEKIHHSNILWGKEGLKKQELCEKIVRNILKISNDRSLHEVDNILYISSLHEGRHKVITIETVRKIKEFIGSTSWNGEHKIVIIDSIDHCNISSANALLKILEEPPEGRYFFLLSSNINKILSTILSRSYIHYVLEDRDDSRLLRAEIPEASEEFFEICYDLQLTIEQAKTLFLIGAEACLGDLLETLNLLIAGKLYAISGLLDKLQKNKELYEEACLLFVEILIKIAEKVASRLLMAGEEYYKQNIFDQNSKQISIKKSASINNLVESVARGCKNNLINIFTFYDKVVESRNVTQSIGTRQEFLLISVLNVVMEVFDFQ